MREPIQKMNKDILNIRKHLLWLGVVIGLTLIAVIVFALLAVWGK